MATSLVIYSADYLTGKAQQTTITGVNPNAANSDIATFAQMTAALSKDTFVKAERVDRANLDAQKPARTIDIVTVRTVNDATAYGPISSDNLDVKLAINETKSYDIETRLPMDYEQGVFPYLSDISIEGEGLSAENSGWARTVYYTSFYQVQEVRGMWSVVIRLAKTVPCTVTATVNVPETDQYKAYSRTLTWTISAKE